MKELGKELEDADKRAQQASEREALLEEERRQGADSELRELFKLDGGEVRASPLASSGIARMGPRYPSRDHLFRQLTTRHFPACHPIRWRLIFKASLLGSGGFRVTGSQWPF